MKFPVTRQTVRGCMANMTVASYAYGAFTEARHGYVLMVVFAVITLFLSVWEDIKNDGK